MNRFMTLFLIFAIISFTVVVADSLEMGLADNFYGGIDNVERSAGSIFNYFGTFFRILTFNLESVPFWFTMFIFYPLVITLIYFVVDILKDLVPLT